MTAKRRYDLKMTRGNPASIEIVDIEDGEVVLFWDCTSKESRRMEEALRHDLQTLGEKEFIDRWSTVDPSEIG